MMYEVWAKVNGRDECIAWFTDPIPALAYGRDAMRFMRHDKAYVLDCASMKVVPAETFYDC